MIKIEFDERDLRSLRVFCGVVSAGGFSAAERTLLMSKASISRHIREVEKRLGVALCERGPTGFRLTAEGEVAARLAFEAIRSLERIKSEIDAVHDVLSGGISIGLGEYSAFHREFFLSTAIAEFKKVAPSVDFHVSIMSFDELNRALRDQTVDIVVRGRYPTDNEFNYLPLFIESHSLYIHNLVADEDAKKLPLIRRNHPYVAELIQLDNFLPGPSVNDIEAMVILIGSGLYQGLIPTHIGSLLEARFPIKKVPGSRTFSHQICAITNKHMPPNRKVEVFLNTLGKSHQAISG